jgi:hypothetical protein
MKFSTWKGTGLSGRWEFSHKIDGVRVHIVDGVAMSRADKPLHNLPRIPDGVYEIFLGSWEKSVSACRTMDGEQIDTECLYQLQPVDNRLVIGVYENPTAEKIKREMARALADGYEGLVLCNVITGELVKVKNKETHDVHVTDIQPGTGKHTGRMGALLTSMGKVGTGFTDAQREAFNNIPLGTVIEVECMSLTPAGKFRHPRFVRVREDRR